MPGLEILARMRVRDGMGKGEGLMVFEMRMRTPKWDAPAHYKNKMCIRITFRVHILLWGARAHLLLECISYKFRPNLLHSNL